MPKVVDRAARQQEILDAAAKVFARKGFAASRIDDVAAEAGVAKGTIYLYFDSRDALLSGVFSSYVAESARVLGDLGDGSALERLGRLVRGAMEMLEAHPDHVRVLLDVWAANPPIDLVGVYRDYRAALAELLDEAAEAGELRPGIGARHAAVIVAAIEGCLVQALVDPELSLGELVEPVVQICVEGIRR
ncbi:TetR/AcrR family transcriptional regulator [Nocardia cyriacigeorgica]|uniref:TetR/AcrR family transcriptional regulator n=1 Tax=Nocardia cyriacigeorgica TaxID=135487 RepID=UPI0024550C0F|nr:TetR/AcrR family transcriptional regulator [Nocardia cyriacigeorgica]